MDDANGYDSGPQHPAPACRRCWVCPQCWAFFAALTLFLTSLSVFAYTHYATAPRCPHDAPRVGLDRTPDVGPEPNISAPIPTGQVPEDDRQEPEPDKPAMPTEGLVLHWTFDRNVDARGEARHVGPSWQLMNGSRLVEGPLGLAASFDGVDDYVNVDGHTDLNLFPITVALWVKCRDHPRSKVYGLVNKYLAGDHCGYQVYIRDEQIRAWYFANRSSSVWDGGHGMVGGRITDGRWHHVAFTVDEAGGVLYVDGKARNRDGWSGRPHATNTTTPLVLGHYPWPPGRTGPNYVAGLMDDIRIYNRALTPEEVRKLAGAIHEPGFGGEDGLVF